jgi:cation transporter-like permease
MNRKFSLPVCIALCVAAAVIGVVFLSRPIRKAWGYVAKIPVVGPALVKAEGAVARIGS